MSQIPLLKPYRFKPPRIYLTSPDAAEEAEGPGCSGLGIKSSCKLPPILLRWVSPPSHHWLQRYLYTCLSQPVLSSARQWSGLLPASPSADINDLSEHSSLTLPASKKQGQVTAFLCPSHLPLCGSVTFWFLHPQFNTASGDSMFEQKMTTEISSIRNPPPSAPVLLLAFPMLCMCGLLDQHSNFAIVSTCISMSFVIGSVWVIVSFQSTNAAPSRGHLLLVLLLNFRKLLLHGVFIPRLLTFCLFH